MTESHLKFIMGTEKRKIREKEQRRQAIIDAAETIIFSKGFDRATMIEIAEEAELSKGTLYLYFKNKDELCIAIANRGSKLLNKKIAKIFSEDHSGIKLVKMMGEIYLDFVNNNPGYYNAFVQYEALRDAHELHNSEVAQNCEEKRREVIGLMIRALQIGMQDGTIHDTYDPKELAVLIWASTRGITMVNHLRETDHHFKLLDSMEIKTESMFKNFLNLIGNGMATEEGKKVYD